ncbi:MAG: hypothetical protein HYW86_01455 [Candidatus Roizmanbacteria bacterium]|nr:MAG: hypothetical protein HYW86_01455 [Candidatus Roizmanbacteria bacterium]
MKIRILLFLIILSVSIFLWSKNLNPFSDRMFSFHDITQFARVSEFTYALQTFQIPPRMAPHFSYNLGYPVFNFYAPFSYWITSLIHLTGFDVASSIKFSFLLSLILAFIFMYKFLKLFFHFHSSLLGAALYSFSPYFAVEIFVRGSLGESWFLTLLPLAFYLIYRNSRSHSVILFIITAFTLSFTLTSHNALSLLFLIPLFFYIFTLSNIKKNLFVLFSALLLSSYFLLPFLTEMSLTYAKEVAKLTVYNQHFLCWNQLWYSPWGYAGSAPGCNGDGMSFMIGKTQIIAGFLGILLFFYNLIRKKQNYYFKIFFFIFLLGLGSIFLSTYSSTAVWEILKPFFSILQFPWRFLVFGIFAVSFFGAYVIQSKSFFIKVLTFVLIITAIFYNAKFFTKTDLKKEEINKSLLSEIYIQQAAYNIPEYLPKTASREEWLKFSPEKNNFSSLLNQKFIQANDNQKVTVMKDHDYIKSAKTSSSNLRLNIHYFPYWKIFINNVSYIPKEFDRLGRPIIKSDKNEKTILLKYEQTPVENLGNLLGIGAIGIFILLTLNRKLWKTMS